MGIQDIIKNDIDNVFTVAGNTPLSVEAVYTPVGGSAETAVTVLYSNSPLHGDEQQNYPVEQEDIHIIGKTSDVSGWLNRGTVTINSFDYEIAEFPYPTDENWSIVALRKPHVNTTKI